MSAKYFIPHCIKPVYLHQTESSAKQCGLVNGLIYSFLVSLIIIVAGGRYYFLQTDPIFRKKILYGIIITLSIIWILVPVISRSGSGTMWRGYVETIDELLAQGYTKQQAIAFLQGLVDQGPQLGLAQGLTAMVFTKSTEKEEKMNIKDNSKDSNKDTTKYTA